MTTKKVAIIGAGASGLVAAKYALENGLIPVVFEKTKNIGGLWAGDGSAIWNGLYTNVSIYSMMFSDHPWPKNSSIFQDSKGIHNYLISYAKRFKIEDHIKFNSKVEHIRQIANKKWEVTWFDSHKKKEIFDCLMVSSGLHSKPRIPTIEDSHKFKGIQIHSSKFKLNDPELKSKKVLVLGCSLSGTEVSANLVNHAQSVTNVFPRPYLVAPRLISLKIKSNLNKSFYTILPLDMFFNKRSTTYPCEKLTKEEIKFDQKKFFSCLFPYQTNKSISNPELYFDLDKSPEILISISDNYIPYVRKNKIKPIKSKIKKFLENGVILENGNFEPADAIVYCTGFHIENSYLDKSILETIKYDTKQHKFSILMYKSTHHPDLENFAMIGQTDGFYFAGNELQAKWASLVFSGKLSLPDRNLMMQSINEEEEKRNLNKNSQFPYGKYVEIIDMLSEEMDLLPNLNKMKEKDPKLYDMFWNSSILSSNFIYKQNKSLALDTMKEVYEMNKRVYEINGDEEITLTQAVNEFSKFYKIPHDIVAAKGY